VRAILVRRSSSDIPFAASASAAESANPNTDDDFAFALALAGELKPKRDSRAPERFSAEKKQQKKSSAGADGGAAERPTCACGAQEEPDEAGTFVFCSTCGVFLSLGGPVRCVCAQAVPPQAQAVCADAEDEVAVLDDADDADDVLWIQCDRCEHYLHANCVWGDAVPEDLSQRAFVCVLCDDDDDDDNDADDADENHEAEGDVGVAVAGNEQNGDEQEENMPDGAPAKKARHKWFWVCGLNGCNFARFSLRDVRRHIKSVHKKSKDDADAAPPKKVLGDVLPERVCEHCGKKNVHSGHIGRCPALLAAAAVDEPAATSVPVPVPAPAPAPLALAVAASAFPPSRLRVPEWQKSAQVERARREALVRKIRALEQLDEAFLASASALYADRKLASEI